jgi:hypothetical protein
MELSAYIHLNPVRAGMVKEPSEYQWSSYRSYISDGKDSLVDRGFLFAQFSKTRSAGKIAYRQFAKSHMKNGHRECRICKEN